MKRPFLATLSGFLVLIVICWNLLQAWTYLDWMDVLTEFSARVAPGLGAGTAIIWAAAWGFILWGIWQKKAWGAKLLPILAVIYTACNWLEWMLWTSPPSNIIFAVIVNVIWLTILIVASKTLAREAYERNIENPEIE